ncbi:MAG: cache domain-containing protein [Burkholderiaceae bacterium]|nr:cache domain-containing protein [Burkholderiaceae bacterium]
MSVAASPSPHSPSSQGFFSHHGIWAPGVRLFRRLGFRAKAALVSLVLLLPLLGLLGWQLLSSSSDAMDAHRDALRKQTQVAIGLLNWAHGLESRGAVSRAQAQQLALAALAGTRWGDGDYYWINDMDARMVMHAAKPELNGRDMAEHADPNGFKLFRAFVDTVRRDGAGYVAYQWPKPGHDKPVDKLSHISGFAPWGWVVGTGIYVDDVAAARNADMARVGLVMALTLALAAYLLHCFYLVMEGGLRETERHLAAITQGDLTTTPSPWGRDEAARLMLSLRDMQVSLRQMVSKVREASDDILHSSEEIANGGQQLQGRVEHTAANLQQSAASMEQISATVRSSAQHVVDAARLADANAEAARRGGEVMAQMADTMDAIQSASSRIGDIIGTIDGIAFQTNILALNAAVEAARAGETGRGFAVVAQEVRALAQRSTGAAREIKQLVQASTERVEAGSGIVRHAGEAIGAIVGSSSQVKQLLDQVAASAREEALGVAQIGDAVTELDRMTQQNAALVEETAAAADAMRHQAQSLTGEVSRFLLPAASGAVAVAAAPVPATPAADFDFDSAIQAHRDWKVKLRKAIGEQGQVDAEALCRDDRCPLGRWLHGPGGRRWGGRPVFQALVDKHAQFHQRAGEVAQRINAADYERARSLLGAESAFSAASTEVVTLLTQAKRGL